MSTTEAAETADLLTRAREGLERYLEVRVDDDGVLTFSHNDVPCVIQASMLADGLAVLSMTCVIAWDLPDEDAIAAAVARRAGEGLFGTLGVSRSEKGVDVTLRYAFPARGMEPAPLGTLMMLVVSTASQLRTELPGLG